MKEKIKMREKADFDRIKGALYGVAVGDALGGPLEFVRRSTIQKAYPNGMREMMGGGWLDLKPGETTDDTAMTLCVANGIVDAELSTKGKTASDDEIAYAVGNRFIAWLNKNPPDVGTTCRLAIMTARRNVGKESPAETWIHAARTLGSDQEGNGALMRCVYPGLWYRDEKTAESVAVLQARMTHSGENSASYCGRYAAAIWKLIRGKMPMTQIAGKVDAMPEDWSPSGYIEETAKAVALAMMESTFEEILVTAVNYGGDADTVGAIAGGVAGAKYGYTSIPQRWIQRLSPTLKQELDRLSTAAYINNSCVVLPKQVGRLYQNKVKGKIK